MKYKNFCKSIWNVLTHHMVMNAISVLLSEYKLSYAVKEQYSSTAKGFGQTQLTGFFPVWFFSSDLSTAHDLWAFDLLTQWFSTGGARVSYRMGGEKNLKKTKKKQ
ncbi:MAG: hypothetical protein ACRCW3_01395 [Metamycoplasmataceae bacterium]